MEKYIERKIKEAVDIIKAGGLVVYPTETVYGLAAGASNRIAILKVFAAKRRPLGKPLSVAVKDIKQAEDLVYINMAAKKLAKAFLPGPITMILKKKALLPKELTSDLDSIGIRIPDHFIALRFIELAGPVTATSANMADQKPPRTAEHAKRQLGDHIDYILDAGECKIGEPSTIVDLTSGQFKILREGSIPRQAIEQVLKK